VFKSIGRPEGKIRAEDRAANALVERRFHGADSSRAQAAKSKSP
jgi:putative heme iron utilization protein